MAATARGGEITYTFASGLIENPLLKEPTANSHDMIENENKEIKLLLL